MSVFSRFTDIINSNINALLDKAEDPEKMIRLIIQEMEDTLVEVRSTAAKVVATKKELERHINKASKQIEDWQDKAELALAKNREDLARAALMEKHNATNKASALSYELQTVNEQVTRLQNDIAQLQNKLSDAKIRQKTMIMRKQTAASRLQVKKHLASDKVDDNVAKFEQYERRLEGLEAQADVYDFGTESAKLSDEFAALYAQDGIDKELAKLKAKLQAKAQADKHTQNTPAEQ